jgi:electron transport complex protein RnfC
MDLTFPVKPFKTHGGADVPHHKNTAQIKSAILPPPKQVVLPMQQHVGPPCQPAVKPGDMVLIGQKIADSSAYVSAPIYASISGRVGPMKKVMLAGGQVLDAVVIDSDGKMEVSPDVKPPVISNLDDFIKAVHDSGLVGLGGAGFPTHVKLKVPEGKTIDTLIINAAECEPYITADNRGAIEDSQDAFAGIREVLKMLKIEKAIIAVEDNKPDVIKVMSELAEKESGELKGHIHVLALRSKYPQGAEKVLIQSCTGRCVPMGKLPADVGCIVMNVTSAAFLGSYLRTGMPLVKKRVTIDGSAIKNPQNVIVPLGTPIKDIIDFCGGYKEPPKKILMGGPMMGIAIASDELPIVKQNNGIICLGENEAHRLEPTECIRCGRCVSGCPMNLMPTFIEKFAMMKRVDGLKKLSVMDCMECGTCAFNCPAGRPLVQAIRLGKSLVKAEGKK